MARNLLVLACSDEIQGDIVITGHPGQGVRGPGRKDRGRTAPQELLPFELSMVVMPWHDFP